MNERIERIMFTPKRRILKIKDIIELGNNRKKIIFTGDELSDFNSPSPDDHVKVFIPKNPVTEITEVPSFEDLQSGKNDDYILRDYTPRYFNNEEKELHLEFFLHHNGPAALWANTAKVGEAIIVAGPRGSLVNHYDFNDYIMIGDETSLPSFARRLEEMPEGKNVLLILNLRNGETFRPLTKTNLSIKYVDTVNDLGEIKKYLQKFSAQNSHYYSWILTEKSIAMNLKAFLIEELNVNDSLIHATGYWRK